jgi:glutathione S-transferase
MSLYTSDNPVFASFSFYAALLGVKTLGMALLTARKRFRKKVSHPIQYSFSIDYWHQLITLVHLKSFDKAFANPEDAKMNKTLKTKTDEDVERVRR